MAILRVVQELYDLHPYVCAGLSLGEYTALTAAEWLPFRQTLPLVQHRGELMNEACEAALGTMAVVMGLDSAVVEEVVREVNLPDELWVANFNCPGQIVLSGTFKGIQAGAESAKKHGAKKVVPLPVYGAFHSGLMKQAEVKLAPYIQKAPLVQGSVLLVMNVLGDFAPSVEIVRHCLTEQVTHSVRWEQGMRAMEGNDVDLYIEIGPGKPFRG